MIVWRAKEGRAFAVDYGMRSPRELDPGNYPVVGGKAQDLFAWPRVRDDRNVQGATAVAVPGVVAGMELAHERFGRKPWRELVAPAVALAREGLLVDWYAGLMIASNSRALAQDPDAAALFLEDGRWPPQLNWTSANEKHLNQSVLSSSLDTVSREGAKALYGATSDARLVKDVAPKAARSPSPTSKPTGRTSWTRSRFPTAAAACSLPPE
jgi:gamma-glutamyltranspeptidase/glutathione hydrolase